MNNFLSRRIAQVAWAIAIVDLLALVFIALFFTIGQPFGSLNDASIGLGALLSALFAWMLYPTHRMYEPRASRWGFGAACVGAVLVALGSVFVISGVTGWVLATWYTVTGYAGIGVWFLLFCGAVRRGEEFPRGWMNFGVVTGAVILFGLFAVPGIVSRTDSMDGLPWYLAVSQISYVGSFILIPVWCLWLGRYLTRKAGAQL